MSKSMIENPDIATTLTASAVFKHALLAIFGGFAHAINAQRNGHTKNLTDFILLMILSSFFGVLFGFVGLALIPGNEYLTLAIAGTGGWLGIEGAAVLIDTIKARFNIK